MKSRCEYAYPKGGDGVLHCRKQKCEKDFCGHQYLCSDTKKWENTTAYRDCAIRRKTDEAQEQTETVSAKTTVKKTRKNIVTEQKVKKETENDATATDGGNAAESKNIPDAGGEAADR